MQRSRVTVRLALVAFAFAATFAFTQVVTPAAPSAPPLASLPIDLAGWHGVAAPPLAPDVAEVLAADQYVHRFYSGPRGSIELDVAYYSRPRVGANMHSPLNCLPGNGWEVTAVQSTMVNTAAGEWPVRLLTARRGDARYVLGYWFQSRSRIVSEEVSSRLYLLADALRGRPIDSGLVRLILPADAHRADPAMIGDFAASFIPELAARMN